METGTIDCAVDYRGRPASRSTTGRWTSASFIVGVEIAERFAYYGISANLISYLTGILGESTASAAAAVNTWSGVSTVLPLLGAFIADSYVGRYKMIIAASLLYILSLGMLTLSSELPALRPPRCNDPKACPPSPPTITFFYFSLYLVALAQGGHKPCVQAFGADQFDQNDPSERRSKSSFFNWWYFAMWGGIFTTLLLLSYVQDNISWGLGFGIPCIAMVIALVIFLLGTKTYRNYLLEDKNPYLKITKILIVMARKRLSWNKRHPTASGEAAAAEHQSNVDEMEEAKGVLRLFPIWMTCLVYAVVFAQTSTFFTKQGSTLYRRIGARFKVPPAALQSFVGITIFAFIPIYDRVIVPIARKFTGIPSGITMLQRIGIGIIFSMISMVVAALVEMRRLRTARDFRLDDSPKATIPMTLWWLVPQYILHGVAETFTMVGLQEFFYDQVPDALRSLGIALYLSIFGIGSFISSLLISVINKATVKSGESWFSSNLNRAHLDYFYWLLAGLSAVELAIYLYFARSYVYKKKENNPV